MTFLDIAKNKTGHEQILLNKNANRFFQSMLPEVPNIGKMSRLILWATAHDRTQLVFQRPKSLHP